MSEDVLAVRIRVLEARTAQLEAQKTARAIGKVGTEASGAGRKAKEASAGLGFFERTLGGIKAIAAGAGLAGVAFGIKDVVEAGLGWQQQQAQLQNALRGTAGAAGGLKDVNEAIDASATHGGFAAGEQTQAVVNFIRETGSATKAIQLNTEATALARGAHLNYATAIRYVQQLQHGAVGRLANYIGKLRPTTAHVDALTAAQKRANPELLKQAKALDAAATSAAGNQRVMQKFGGATSVFAHTAAGAISDFKNQVDLLSERLGAALLPAITKVAKGFSRTLDYVQRHKDTFRDLGEGILIAVGAFAAYEVGAFAAGIATTIYADAALIAAGATEGFAGAIEALSFVFSATPIGAVILAIGLLVGGLILAYHKVKWFHDGVNAAFSGIKTGVAAAVGFIKEHWKLLGAILLGPFAPLFILITHFKTVKTFLIGVFGDIAHFVSNVFDGVANTVIDAINLVLKAINFAIGAYDSIPGFLRPTDKIGKIGLLGHLGDDHPKASAPGGAATLAGHVATAAASRAHQTTPTATTGGGGSEVIHLHHTTNLDGRVLAESTTAYQLKRAARATGR